MMINEPLFKKPLTLYTLNFFGKRTLSSLRAETDAEKSVIKKVLARSIVKSKKTLTAIKTNIKKPLSTHRKVKNASFTTVQKRNQILFTISKDTFI